MLNEKCFLCLIKHIYIHTTPEILRLIWLTFNPLKAKRICGLEQFFVRISPRIAARCLKLNMLLFVCMRYKQSNFGSNRSVVKSTLLFRQKQFFVPLLPRIAAGWLKHKTGHFLHMRYTQCKLGWNRSVMKGTLLLRPKQFLVRLTSRCRGVTETPQVALPAHMLQAM
jgi:hypothetical protein